MNTITGPYVLPEDLTRAPVARLPARERARIASGDGEVAVGRAGVRQGVKVLSADAARLLDSFRSPTTIVDAVLAYAGQASIEPAEALRQAYPILRSLIDAHLLVPAGSADVRAFAPALADGAIVAGYTIVRCVQVVEDTEVYQAQGPAGPALVKMTRPTATDAQRAALVRECAVTARLDGAVNPCFLAAGVQDGSPFLVTEWCDGAQVDVVAAGLASDAGRHGGRALLDLVVCVVDAFGALHAQGVVHGDVHPRNVMIAQHGQVRILDYGASPGGPSSAQATQEGRPGMPSFFEPEVAAALLEGRPVPAASFGGEQHAVAALAYLLLCGAHPLHLSYERERMLAELAHAPPLPFARPGVVGWQPVEQVLRTALRKSPGDRFPDVAALGAALRDAVARVAAADARCAGPARGRRPDLAAGAALVAEVLAHLEPSSFRPVAWTTAPAGSIVAGSAGAAYTLWRLALLRGEPRLLALADVYASRLDSRRADAYTDAASGLTSDAVGTVSPYVAAGGVPVVKALIAAAMGDSGAVEQAVEDYLPASAGTCTQPELYLGRAGTLMGCALVHDVLDDDDAKARDVLQALGRRSLGQVCAMLDDLPPVGAPAGLVNLGMAHGWAGALYAILRWCAVASDRLPAMVCPRLEELAGLGRPSGAGLRWEWRLPNDAPGAGPTFVAGWCNGGAGFVHLWTTAHELLGDPVYLELATKAAWTTWEDVGGAGASLCCGSAGRAYALLRMANYAGDPRWKLRAMALAGQAIAEGGRWPPTTASLYRGRLGVALLAADLAQPELASMPFFEPAA